MEAVPQALNFSPPSEFEVFAQQQAAKESLCPNFVKTPQNS
jgi:hypothetical protein